MPQPKLDKEEQDILDSYDKGEWRSVKNIAKAKQELQAIARRTIKKDTRLNIRLSSKDRNLIQQRAIEEGIPYQTLIASVLHKFVLGRLVEQRI